MNPDRVEPRQNIPENISVIIEIPAHSDPGKYEVDKATGAIFVDRFLDTAMHYPCNYNYIPHTLAEDGDPVDAFVITTSPHITDTVIRCRPISVLSMIDESGPDAKILAVPIDSLSSCYRHVQVLDDLPQQLLKQISHFFDHYKDMEESKWVRIEGWEDRETAHREILSSIERFNNAPIKPCF